MKTEPNQPASPTYFYDFQPYTGDQVVREQFNGLTKREHFAALAMQGLLANEGILKAISQLTAIDPQKSKGIYAVCAVEHADALIDALNAHAEPEPDPQPEK